MVSDSLVRLAWRQSIDSTFDNLFTANPSACVSVSAIESPTIEHVQTRFALSNTLQKQWRSGVAINSSPMSLSRPLDEHSGLAGSDSTDARLPGIRKVHIPLSSDGMVPLPTLLGKICYLESFRLHVRWSINNSAWLQHVFVASPEPLHLSSSVPDTQSPEDLWQHGEGS